MAAAGGALAQPTLIRSEKANSSVAKATKKGINCANLRSGVSTNSDAPIPAPIIEATIRPRKARLIGGNCERSERAASIAAGAMEASVQTMVDCGGTPVASSAGMVTTAPPPTITPMMPASMPALASDAM